MKIRFQWPVRVERRQRQAVWKPLPPYIPTGNEPGVIQFETYSEYTFGDRQTFDADFGVSIKPFVGLRDAER